MISNELAEYIKSQQLQGKSDQEVKEILVAHGYTAEQADTALHHTASHQADGGHEPHRSQHHTKRSKKNDVPVTQYAIVTILCFLIVLLTPFRGIFLIIGLIAAIGWIFKIRIPRRIFWFIFFIFLGLPLIVGLIVIASYNLIPARFNPSKTIAQDTTRRINLQDLQVALTDYQQKNNQYPAQLSSLAPDYMKKVPKDPITNKAYSYQIAAGGKDYRLCATMKDNKEQCVNAAANPFEGVQKYTSSYGWSISYDASMYGEIFPSSSQPDVIFSQAGPYQCMQSYRVSVLDNPKHQTVTEWRKEYYADFPEQLAAPHESVTVNGESAEKYTLVSTSVDANTKAETQNTDITYYIPKDDKLYELYYSNIGHGKYTAEQCQANEAIIKQSIETFKIVDAT